MWVLAIDTATPLPGIALAGDGTASQAPLPTGRQASEALLPVLAELLSSSGIRLRDLGRIAVCSGPGSFTGIRVGLATAWGLSRAASIPLETLGALEAVAELARGSGARRVCPSFAAERGEVYFGEYELEDGRAAEVRPPILVPRDAARDVCPPGADFLPLDPAQPGDRLPALAAASAVRRAPGATARAPRAFYVRLSAAEEYRGVRAS